MNATFTYDGLGRREKKTINGNMTEFLYDKLNPVQETSGATILANILPGLGIDEFLSRTDVAAGTTSNFLTDALGSSVAVTDSAGVIQTDYTYEPFGKTALNGVSNSNPYQFTGRENDASGLYYYRARYYHPGLARLISEDPIIRPMVLPSTCMVAPSLVWAVPDLLNQSGRLTDSTKLTSPYLYAGNNPVLYRDPTGLDKDKDPDCLGRAQRNLMWCIGLTLMMVDMGEAAIIIGCTHCCPKQSTLLYSRRLKPSI